jgi:Pyridoxamine 5'-phosphate oxidase
VPREQIDMSPDEWRAFLAEQRWIVLGTLEAEGEPWATLAPATLGDVALYFAVPAAGRAQRNLERDPRACCASDTFPSYYEIRGATAHGVVTRVDDGALVQRFALQIASDPLPGWREDGDLALWSLPLDDVFGFDFGKIRAPLTRDMAIGCRARPPSASRPMANASVIGRWSGRTPLIGAESCMWASDYPAYRQHLPQFAEGDRRGAGCAPRRGPLQGDRHQLRPALRLRGRFRVSTPVSSWNA